LADSAFPEAKAGAASLPAFQEMTHVIKYFALDEYPFRGIAGG
jgi:hypothetical protein